MARNESRSKIWAWLQILGSFMICLNNFGLVVSYGMRILTGTGPGCVYQAYYQQGPLETYSTSAISWIGTVQAALLVMIGVLSGPVYDRGFLRTLVFTGTFLEVFGLMMLSLSSQYYQIFLCQGLVLGVGHGLLFIPSIACVSSHFAASQHRGLAIALALAGASIGGVIYPIMFRHLQATIGFAWATRAIGFVALATLLLSCTVLRQPTLGQDKEMRPRQLLDMSALRDLPFMLFTLGCFFVFLGYNVPLFLVPQFGLEVLGLSADTAFDLLAILNAASFVSRVVSATFIDRVGAISLLVAGNAAGAVTAFSWMAVHDYGGFVAFCCTYGLLVGLMAMTPSATIPSLCPSPAVIGTRFGMALFPAGVAILISAPVASAITASSGSAFLGPQLWTGATIATGALLQIQPLIHVRSKSS